MGDARRRPSNRSTAYAAYYTYWRAFGGVVRITSSSQLELAHACGCSRIQNQSWNGVDCAVDGRRRLVEFRRQAIERGREWLLWSAVSSICVPWPFLRACLCRGGAQPGPGRPVPARSCRCGCGLDRKKCTGYRDFGWDALLPRSMMICDRFVPLGCS